MADSLQPHEQTRPRHIGVIPCRWGSTRFPGKPLALLAGKPLIWHVYQRCTQAQRLTETVVATDDERIERACRQLDIPCVMTSVHPTGTDCVAECADKISADGYINVQGDEPFIAPAAIDAVSEALQHLSGNAAAVNAYSERTDISAVLDHNVVKVVLSIHSKALLFSRQPIPYPKDRRPTYLRQLGLYGFTVEGLRLFIALPQGNAGRTAGTCHPSRPWISASSA
ncbi:3-deoxy-manno-octulosonate cytidylyltransferase [Streptomyces albiaxialis]|uniref:3-deoxy-manno-octulosonate cytidylyltransferase n=1 Tax=Streptomyces albiaxialis TaxID=329523 RepID=A0ABN2WVE3_9ACTN